MNSPLHTEADALAGPATSPTQQEHVKKRRSRRRNPDATEFAKNQRATANEIADDVWQLVRNRRCCGEKFRREHSIEPYTVDFCCVALKLVVEVDGANHFTEAGVARDRVRDQCLASLGYDVLRIPGYEVLRDSNTVRDRIAAAIHRRRGA